MKFPCTKIEKNETIQTCLKKALGLKTHKVGKQTSDGHTRKRPIKGCYEKTKSVCLLFFWLFIGSLLTPMGTKARYLDLKTRKTTNPKISPKDYQKYTKERKKLWERKGWKIKGMQNSRHTFQDNSRNRDKPTEHSRQKLQSKTVQKTPWVIPEERTNIWITIVTEQSIRHFSKF